MGGLTVPATLLGILYCFIITHPHLVQANPSGSISRIPSCPRSDCPDGASSAKFRYTPGRSYSYRYEVDVASFVDGISSGAEESRIHLGAKVHFDVHTPCHWAMRVSDVTLQDSEPLDPTRRSSITGETAFRKTLETSTLAFTFRDGLIPHICPSTDEPAWSLNIKRGILSTMQNTMARFDLDHQSFETDASGSCTVDYVFNGAVQNTINILKTRDLSSCSNRYGQFYSFSGAPYQFLGPSFESWPLINSTSSCQQTVAAHKITQSDCEEKHVFRPFSHEGSGATTTAKQLLTFLEDQPMTTDEENEDSDSLPAPPRAIKVFPKVSMLFQHSSKIQELPTDSFLTLPAILQRLCQNVEEGVDSEAAGLFGRLVNALRSMDYPSLGGLMAEAEAMCRDGQAARRHLLNGLISAGTSDSVAAMRDEILNGKVEANLVNRWATSLAFIPRPTVIHLTAALPLLDMPNRPQQIGLSISSLAKKLCSSACPPEVLSLVAKLTQPLGSSCQSRSREEREEVILALKSLANVGPALSGGHLDSVTHCFERDNPAEVRVAALQTMRDTPCSAKEDGKVWKILADSSEDSEIRITLYLIVMKCPDYNTILKIKDLLLHEEVNQVGSFIWTHLRNLATTALPSKLGLQALILDQELANKFKTDARKFSRNYEQSILFDQYNAAASMESNVIFSQQSYLPRSASLNLTVNLFGNSVNLFELNGRFEGFERYIESLFGPGGLYQQKEISHILESLRPNKRKTSGMNPTKLTAMDKQFDAASQFQDEPEMSLSMRLFGSDVGYSRWEGRKEILQTLGRINPVSKLHHLMNGEEVNFSYASQYIDSTYVVPLSAGLPLKLMARGHVITDVRGHLKTDFQSMLKTGKGDMSWKIHPSAAINFDGSMTVDALAVNAGVKLTATLHSSVSTSGKFVLDGLRLVDFQVDLPQEKIEIINMKSEIILLHRRLKTSLPGIVENRVELSSCSRGPTQRLLGLHLCADMAYPNASESVIGPNFPLTGPAQLSVELVKFDPSITSYRFLHQIENKENLKAWTLTYRPEGTKDSKEVGLRARIETDSGHLGLKLMLPSNSYEVNGTFKWDAETKTIEASFVRDGTHQLLVAKASLERAQRSKQMFAYQPKLLLTYADRNLVDLSGEVKLTEKKGTLKYDLDLNSKLGSWNTVTKGYYLMDEKSHISNLTVEYKVNPRNRPERIKVEVKLNNGTTQGLRQYDVHLGIEPSAYPDRNFVGTWRLQQGQNHLDNQITLNTGPWPKDNRNTLTINQGLAYSGSSAQNLKFKSRFEMTLPAKDLDLGLILGYEQTDYKTDTLFIGRYATGKEAQCGVMIQKRPGVLFHATGAFNLTLPSQPVVKLSGRIQEESKNSYKTDVDGVWGEETDFQLSGSYSNQIKNTESEQDLRVEVTGSSIYPIEFAYSYHTNKSALEAQIQSSYGKDALSLYLIREDPSKNEMKIGTKIGYLNYLHTIETYWNGIPDGQKGYLDVHVDKVLDIRGDFSTDLSSSGRRDTSLDLRWDANRDPGQKLTVKTSFEPGINVNDWTAAVHLSYPGSFIKSNFAALTQRDNRTITGMIDLGSRRSVIFSAGSFHVDNTVLYELFLDTPFPGWSHNKAVFTSETKDRHHKTGLMALWGDKQFFEAGLEARLLEDVESKGAEASIGVRSSSERLDGFKVTARTEMQPRTLDSSITFLWGKDQQIGITSTFEWSFEGQFLLRSELGLTSPFPQLSQVKLELITNTEWESAQLFENRGTLIIEDQKYTILLKGVKPSANKRWEISALLTSPQPDYEIIGISSHYSTDEKEPSFDMQVNWPGKQAGLNVAADFLTDGLQRGRFEMKLPFQNLKDLAIDGAYLPLETAMKFDFGTRWNTYEFVTFNTSWEMESTTSGDFLVDLRTSIAGHEKYGTRLAVNLDLSEFPSASTVVRIVSPIHEIGFSANGSMTEMEDSGSLTTGTFRLEIADQPDVTLEFNHDSKALMDYKTNVVISRGNHAVNMALDVTTSEEYLVLRLEATSTMAKLSDVEFGIRFRKEYLEDPNNEFHCAVASKWKSYGEPQKLAAHVKYSDVVEDLEDFTQKSTVKMEFIAQSPWELAEKLSVKFNLTSQNSEMDPVMELLYNDQAISLNGNINFLTQSTSMEVIRKTQSQAKPLTVQVNSAWEMEDNQIKVNGTVATSMPGFKNVPWNLEVTIIDSEEDENVWERKISGEAQISKTQFILLNAALMPSKLTVNLATPFETVQKMEMTFDYDRMAGLNTVAAELRLNSHTMEMVGNMDWPEESTLPVDAKLTLTTPFEYKLVSLVWNSADPLSAAKLTASVTRDSQSYSFDGHYELALPEKADIQVQLTGMDWDTWSFQLNSEISSDGLTGYLSLGTPLNGLRRAELSALMGKAEQKYQGSVTLDSNALTGKVSAKFVGNDGGDLRVEAKMEIEDHFKFSLLSSVDPEYRKVNFDTSVFGWAAKSKFQRDEWSKYDWNTEVSSELDKKWLVDLDLDFKDIRTLYRHNLTYQAVHHSAMYNTFASWVTDDIQYKGRLGADWGAEKPLELKFTSTKIAKLLGNAMVEILTPWTAEPSLTVNIDVDARKPPIKFKILTETAEKIVVAALDMKYVNLYSMQGNTVVNTTFKWLPSATLDFSSQSTKDMFNGSYLLRWSDKHVVDINVNHLETPGFFSVLNRKNVQGGIQVKTSWPNLPEATLKYARDIKTPVLTETWVQLNHNFTEVIHVMHKSTEQSSAGQEMNQDQVEVRGTIFAGGFSVGRVFHYSGGTDGDNLPRSLTRTANIYEVGQWPKFIWRVELTEKENTTGKQYQMNLSSAARTISFTTHYNIDDGVFLHGSQFAWRPNARIGYDIEVENRTTTKTTDYVMTTNFFTPVRSMGVTSTIRHSKNTLRAVCELLWDLTRKDSIAKMIVLWDNTTRSQDVNSDRIRVSFSQGNLPQDLAILTEVHRSAKHPLNMRTEIQYSNEPERNVAINTLVTADKGNYRAEMNVTHPVTQLELRQVLSYERNPSGRAQIVHTFSHSRQDAELLVLEHYFIVEPQEGKVYFSASSPMLTMRHQAQLSKSGNRSLLTYEANHDDSAVSVAELSYDPDLPLVHFVAHYDHANTKDIHLKAGIPDKRHMIFEVFKQAKDERLPVFDFVFRLNHSRLVTSRTRWPADWQTRFTDIAAKTKNTLSLIADQWVAAFVTNTVSEAAGSMLYIVNDIYEVLNIATDNFIAETEKLYVDYKKLEQNVIDGYNSNAFYAKLAVDMGSAIIKDIPFGAFAKDFVEFFEKTGNRLFEPFTGEQDGFTQWRTRVAQRYAVVKSMIASWLGDQWADWPTAKSSKFLEELGLIFRNIAEEYDQFVKRLQQNILDAFHELAVPLRSVFRDSWNDIYNSFKPLVVRGFITAEAAAWNVMKEVLDFLYEQREEVARSNYFQKLSLLLDDLQQFYLDMQSIDWPANVRKYLSRAGQFLQQKYSDLDEYLVWLDRLKMEIEILYEGFMKENPELEKGAENGRKLLAFLQWSYEYLKVNDKLSDLIVAIRERGSEVIYQTATDAQMRYSPQKTLFLFNPERGSIDLEQKLPMPWISLDEMPRFEQLPEMQRIRSFLAMFETSNTSVVDQILSYIPGKESLTDLIPPFKSSAHLVGLQHFVTFDGHHYDFAGPCTYLLARDFLTHNFTLAVHYLSSRGKPYASLLQLEIEETRWELDLANHTIRVDGSSRLLPTEERGAMAYYEDDKFVVESPVKGLRLECIAAYEVCTLTLSGWYSNKVAGMLGTMDNEPTTDQIRPDRVIDMDLPSLARSWDISSNDGCKTMDNLARKPSMTDEKLAETCHSVFYGPRSTMKSCLSIVDPAPYVKMCSVKPRVKSTALDGCHAAAAYVASCSSEGVSIRIPPHCVRCQLENELLSEGDSKTFKMTDKTSRSSSDVVLLMEMKKCNEPDAQSRRFLPQLLHNLDKELNVHKITKNRYALVLFGGTEPYNSPKVRTLRGQEFVTIKEFDNLLHNLTHGDGTESVENALRFASHLNFRPGASKTFILLTCSSCNFAQEDYSLMLQTMMDQDVTLHVLMDAEFRFSKPNASRQFLGLDALSGFTPKEMKGRPTGDADLRRQAKLPKAALEMCAPLALETNGTIFTVSRMRKNVGDSKRAINVWVKRVVATANPTDCHQCTCQIKNRHSSALDCRTCTPRTSPIIDTSFLVDDSVIQRLGKSISRPRLREEEKPSESTTTEVAMASEEN